MGMFFTSDTHFDHVNIVQYCKRPFQTVDEMNMTMVAKWNSVVTEQDVVYHLGDFALGRIGNFTKWANQLNGKIRIVPGSHDHYWLKHFAQSEKIQTVAPLLSLEISNYPDHRYKQVLVLCHYSMQTWDRSHYGSWHLFGHSHGSLKGVGLSFDVGVDCTDFTPLSFEQVADKFERM